MSYEAELKDLKLFKKGKVRDVYDLEDSILMIASDRISCFDVILPTPIPDKGKILTQVSLFWFDYLKDAMDNHLISSDMKDLPSGLQSLGDALEGRFMLAKKCKVIPCLSAAGLVFSLRPKS